jgi:AraC-like DNA-binding protein
MSNFRHTPDEHIQIRTFAVTFEKPVAAHHSIPARAPDWHKLIHGTRGVMTVHTEKCAWVAPPYRAVWIPAGIDFRLELSGSVAMRLLYLRPGRRRWGPFESRTRDCSVVNVTPLLRELICRVCRIGALNSRLARDRRLIGVIRDELNVLIAAPLQLPVPRDPRAVQFAAASQAALCDGVPLAKILRSAGASRRTMERLYRSETSLTLGQWLRRQKLLQALRRLAAGETVNAVALDLGYNSSSAFIAMFRRELGSTPTSYFEPSVG